MSLVGNFAFNNYDDQQRTAGAGYPRTGSGSQSQSQDTPLGLHRTSSAYSRPGAGDKAAGDKDGALAEKKDLGGSGDDSSSVADGGNPKLSRNDETSSEDEEDKRRDVEVTQLARQISTYSDAGLNPLEADKDSRLNPYSEHFNVKAWTRAMLNLFDSDSHSGPRRTAGIAFKNLNVFGFGQATDYQKTVSNIWLETVGFIRKLTGQGHTRRIDILRDFEGVVHAGEMLVVLGPPGSGCSTLLKTISGETHGFNIEKDSYINYQGIEAAQMHKDFRGEAIYTAEIDEHFPMMTVGDTLTFAARARAPRYLPGGMTRNTFADHMRDVVMATFGISHTVNTFVGNEYVRGVSGGERKRVTIAEAALSGAPLQCWDNSTRGLDSANAIEFCRTLRMSTQLAQTTACVAIYQSPQAAYDLFDKVIVLYEGRQIFFGKADKAQEYFESLGFACPDRQTTADFCTSMTSPAERVVRKGWENRVPNTPDDFAAAWKESESRKLLLKEIDAYDQKYSLGGEYLQKFKESRRAQQAKQQRVKSPYTLSYFQQVNLCLWRGFQRLKGDPSLTLTQLFGNFAMALVVGSVFYNLQPDTNSFFSRGALIFFAVLLNAFGSALEILTLYAQRQIVEKHTRYAFYHPSAEAFASMLTDLPYKVLNSIIFNLALYFLTNLRREPGAFFFFLLITFFLTLIMSMIFRTIASLSRTLAQAMAPAAVLILAIIIFTGFAIPVQYMLGWCRWINYVDPVAYGFESLMINEFHNREFDCSLFIPRGGQYDAVTGNQRICATTGSTAGQTSVNGDAYLLSSFGYVRAHKWRNFGIMIAFMFGFMFIYLIATEYVSAKKSKGEVLVFQRGHIPAAMKQSPNDEEAGDGAEIARQRTGADRAKDMIQKQTSIFSWRNVCYDIKIKGEPRRILDKVDGWVKPGTLTALMGVSGAGKTSLLDALATRTTTGVITGEMLVDGRQRDTSFQRKTGYVQQQDLHLSTSTVREALIFSALLRQPAKTPRQEKVDYVEEVIKLLEMEDYADAVVGVPGEGLNVEQRKRLTIGVELAAKPELLLFLDEPTSGLDSQTSWAICDLMEKLTQSGQAVLCTIHQPSAMLFERFDRLLFLQKGGQTVYFGEIGHGAKVLIDFFERNGAPKCPDQANPAEWMLEAIGAAPGSHTDVDWFDVWRNSPEYKEVHSELDRLRDEGPSLHPVSTKSKDKASYREFAAPFGVQMWEVQKRVFQQYWRTPSYIYSKTALCLSSSLFIGLVFLNSPLSQQGLQNQMFAFFLLLTIFGQLVQQIMPHFVTQRALYEVRERPSKTYSWKAFMLSNIFAELPYQTLMAVIIFVCWYYPIGMYKNAEPTGEVHIRGFLMFLLIVQFLWFASTFTHFMIAAIETAETGGNIGNLLFSLSLIFCGVLASPTALPGFWIFMYRVSPFTYLVSAVLATGLANTNVTCAANEYLHFSPPQGQTCDTYLSDYKRTFGGYNLNGDSMTECSFCQIQDTNVFLASISADYSNRWRNFGIIWVYIVFNIFAALALYYLVRMPKEQKKRRKGGKKNKSDGDEGEQEEQDAVIASSRDNKGEKEVKRLSSSGDDDEKAEKIAHPGNDGKVQGGTDQGF